MWFVVPAMQTLSLVSKQRAALAACLLVMACGGAPDDEVASDSAALSSKCAPEAPATLAVPSGNKFAFALDAVGWQIYTCQASAGSYAWVFSAPSATLYNNGGQVAGTHYAGPTWQANDGSTVVGARVAGATVDATSIPWLLLRAVSHNDVEGRMSKVTYVQRLETVGGLAPSSGCDADHVGTTANVDYTAVYAYYVAGESSTPASCE